MQMWLQRALIKCISQIKDRRYPEALREYQGNILLVGISYNKEDKKHECTIEEWDKG